MRIVRGQKTREFLSFEEEAMKNTMKALCNIVGTIAAAVIALSVLFYLNATAMGNDPVKSLAEICFLPEL
jgi:hypothetical protein